MGLLHIDAHSDTAPDMMGERLAHGTPFRYYKASNLKKGDLKKYFLVYNIIKKCLILTTGKGKIPFEF